MVLKKMECKRRKHEGEREAAVRDLERARRRVVQAQQGAQMATFFVSEEGNDEDESNSGGSSSAHDGGEGRARGMPTGAASVDDEGELVASTSVAFVRFITMSY